MSGTTLDINDTNFQSEIIESGAPALLDFYATWCGPCVMLAKELEAVGEELGDSVRILKVDCDEEEDLALQLQIR